MSALQRVVNVFVGYGRKVHVCVRVARIWHAARQTTPAAKEACGVLIGTVSPEGNSVWLELATRPKPLDVRRRSSFKMVDPGHARIVQMSFAQSQQTRIYLGTWHTHPTMNAKPSLIDRNDWHRCVRRNPNRPLVFAIVGTAEVSLYVKANGRFRILKENE